MNSTTQTTTLDSDRHNACHLANKTFYGKMRTYFLFVLFSMSMIAPLSFAADGAPVRLIFDTDIGNDVDDTLALAVIHALQNRGECELLWITITKDNPYAAPMTQAVNTFYGRPDIPIAVVKNGVTKEDGKYLKKIVTAKDANGEPLYLKDTPKTYPEAVTFLRNCLAAQPDNSVVIVQVGFFTNLARLLATKGDDISPLKGKELVAKKVKLCSIMAGNFHKKVKEYNVMLDIPSAQKLVQDWPTKIVFSGYEIGNAIRFPLASAQNDFNYVPNHIVKEAYRLYIGLNRRASLYDLTSVLYAVRPDRDYFDLSEPGCVTFTNDGRTKFAPTDSGKHYFMRTTPIQNAKVAETLGLLSSEPPKIKTSK